MDHREIEMAKRREDYLRYCLLLMCYQYCVDSREKMDHEFCSAGEHAFHALGIEYGTDAKIVWDRIDQLENSFAQNGWPD